MRPGPQLVIAGAVLGSLILAFFLLSVPTGASSPALVSSARAASPPTPVVIDVPQEEIAVLESTSPILEIDSDCKVNERFPHPILQWCGLITQYSLARGLDPNLIAALIWQESGGDPAAVSVSGAVGLMQVMPSDGPSAGFQCINGPCFSGRPSTSKLKDPEFNISYGTKMLSGLLARNSDLREALKAYGPMNIGYAYADTVLGIFRSYGQ